MTYTLEDLKSLVVNYSGNDNPTIFVLDDNCDDSEQAFKPTCIFIDDDGDIIIQVSSIELTKHYHKGDG